MSKALLLGGHKTLSVTDMHFIISKYNMVYNKEFKVQGGLGVVSLMDTKRLKLRAKYHLSVN